jgi:hypothetical protein
LNLNNFKMIEAMGLKIIAWGPVEWHYLPTKFHENLSKCSKVISKGHTDRFDKPTLMFGKEAKNYMLP